MYNSVICRYNEIATKGNNRSMFENTLMRNMRSALKHKLPGIKISKSRGRVYIRKEDGGDFSDDEIQVLTENLKRCFGLDSFSMGFDGPREYQELMDILLKFSRPLFQKHYDQGASCVKFRSRIRRADKNYPVKSRDVEIEYATKIEELFGENRVKVDLENPDVSIGVEIREDHASIFLDKINAAGGLPVGSNSSLLGLLSGGIDSPVACVMAMKRGCRMDFLTFHSFPYTPMESVEKVYRIAKIINQWQTNGTLFACNLSEIQKLIRDNCDPRCRTVLYRRMMMRIASFLCHKRKLAAIVTGEAVGQVASQTVANMRVIDSTVPDLILRPLCGMDKNETIERARQLGTFDVSIEPMIDSCTVFAPKSPILHAKLGQIEHEEQRIPNLWNAIAEAFRQLQVIKYDGLELIVNKPFKEVTDKSVGDYFTLFSDASHPEFPESHEETEMS